MPIRTAIMITRVWSVLVWWWSPALSIRYFYFICCCRVVYHLLLCFFLDHQCYVPKKKRKQQIWLAAVPFLTFVFAYSVWRWLWTACTKRKQDEGSWQRSLLRHGYIPYGVCCWWAECKCVCGVLTHVNIFRSIACENTSFDAIKVIWCDNACAMKIMYIWKKAVVE